MIEIGCNLEAPRDSLAARWRIRETFQAADPPQPLPVLFDTIV